MCWRCEEFRYITGPHRPRPGEFLLVFGPLNLTVERRLQRFCEVRDLWNL